MKLMFVINSFDIGGAERMLNRLTKNVVWKNDQIMVVCLKGEGQLTESFRAQGHSVLHLGLSKNPMKWMAAVRLALAIISFKPDVIHSWLYQSDLLAGVMARLLGNGLIVWSIRQSDISKRHNKLATRLIIKICARFSHFIPHAIVSCSKRAKEVHLESGYSSARTHVIPNGIDLALFQHDEALAYDFRNEICVEQDVPLIGMVGRFDSQKNHEGFMQMAKQIQDSMPKAKFCLAGKDVSWSNDKFCSLLDEFEVDQDSIRLLGERNDLVSIFSAIDVLALPSHGEAFPNVVVEAMACCTPAVVTDVGDAADIVGDIGFVVAKEDMNSFAKAIISVCLMTPVEKRRLGYRARKRVICRYDINKIAEEYRSFYFERSCNRAD